MTAPTIAADRATPTTAPGRFRRHTWRSLGRRVLTGLAGAALSVAVICGVWQALISGFHTDPFLTRGPADVWRYLTDPTHDAQRELLRKASLTTAVDAVIGMVAGTLGGLAVAIGFALWRAVRQSLLPMAMALRAVPLVAMTPLIALIFGRGLVGVTVIVGIVTFFPVLVNVTLALRAVPAPALDLMRAYGASPYATLWKVQLPSALPALFAAVRVAAPLALVGALLAEWLITGQGLGYLMLQSVTTFQLDQMWSAVALVTVASILAYTIISAIEQLVLVRYSPERARDRRVQP